MALDCYNGGERNKPLPRDIWEFQDRKRAEEEKSNLKIKVYV
jgi:hypothetical protein